MIKFLLAALILLNVSVLANVEIADEEEEIDYDKEDDRLIEQTVNEEDGQNQNIKRVQGDEESSKVIRQFIDKSNKQKRDRLKDKFNNKIPYEKWEDDTEEYKDYKADLFKHLGWTIDWTKMWSQQAPNVGQMSSDKFLQYIVSTNGTFIGHNQTWVILIGTSVNNQTQDVGREMNILARKFKRAKKTTYRWDFIDYVVDERLALTFTFRNEPMLYVIDGHDQMVYAWDQPFSTPMDNRTIGLWLKDREYKQSALSFPCPRLINSKMSMRFARITMWVRKHIGWGFQNSMRSQPQVIKNLFAPVMDHDGNDPLRLKADNLIKYCVIGFFLFVVLPFMYFLAKFLFWLCAYTVIIEVEEEEKWEELKK